MHYTRRATALAIALTVWAPSAHGQTGATAVFDRADVNHDGRITRAEYVNARMIHFTEMDRNHDDRISKDDYPAASRYPRAAARLDAAIGEADRNGDGAVTRGELLSARTPQFDRTDTDHDGSVDQRELAALKATIARR